MSEAVAHDCNYTNALTNTGHGARHCGISAVDNSCTGPSTVKKFTCHTNIDQSTTYHESNEVDQMRAAVAVQGLKDNNTVNVADVDTYYNDDDGDQPTQRQNQPSHRGRYPNPPSHNDQSITSPNRKRYKSRNHSSTESRSPDLSHYSYEFCRHHHHRRHSSSRCQSEKIPAHHSNRQFQTYNDQHATLTPHNLYQQQTRSLSLVPYSKCYYVIHV